jgi:hypothetical protein
VVQNIQSLASFDQLNQYPGFLHLSDWKKALIGGSFDGATVMLGSLGGTAKLLKDKVETHLTILHAAAHVEQLALGDAFKEVTYYDEWGGIVQEVYVYYNASGKKRFGLEAVANALSPVRVLEVLRRAVEVLRQAVSTAPETGVKTG